jgi:POTRA domain, FtsQ-type
MRKKSKRGNARKFRFKSLFARRRADDETEWFRFDEEPVAAKTSPRRRIRRKLLFAKLTAVACLSISIPVAIKWGYGEVFFKNEEFVLKTLQIQTDGVLSVSRLAEIANVAAGMNLMDLDLGQIQTQIETLPQVEKATVNRELPDRLHLVVRERIPVAWLSVPPLGVRPWDMERGFLLDEEGHLFRCLDLNDGMKSLPVVESFQMSDPVEGAQVDSEGVLSGLKLILESEKRFAEEGLSVREVRVRDEWAVECDYSNHLRVTFGVYDYERGLDDFALILDRMAESGRTLASVNVAAEKNIPVTFAVAAAAEGGSVAPQAGQKPSIESTQAPASAPQPQGGAAGSDQEKHLRSILKGG